MNNTKKLRSALLSSLTIIASIVLGHTAQAASLYFREAGAQLDDDNILDIDVTGKKQIGFKIFINTLGLNNDIDVFNYTIEYDTKELKFRGIEVGNRDPDKGIEAGNVTDKDPPVGRDADNEEIRISGVDNIARNKIVHITTITFDIVKPGLKPDDGLFDFKIGLAGGKYADEFKFIGIDDVVYGEWNNLNGRFQQVEVQTPEPTSILGLFSLGIIGVGATIKRQVKRNHSIEKETTKIG